eukprot:TRINITY_DN5061_c0_g1_i1.p1 TRINITY_DN5061_c0_g1~~TRINITY_DN5061_c0_g1_i1.p1  ORF type:complete len:835 (+),score=202.44 TRINITY_DN5061_c0_g1_i1:76-2580(+)
MTGAAAGSGAKPTGQGRHGSTAQHPASRGASAAPSEIPGVTRVESPRASQSESPQSAGGGGVGGAPQPSASSFGVGVPAKGCGRQGSNGTLNGAAAGSGSGSPGPQAVVPPKARSTSVAGSGGDRSKATVATEGRATPKSQGDEKTSLPMSDAPAHGPRQATSSPSKASDKGGVKKCMSLQLDVNWEMENTLCISSEGHEDDDGGNPLLVPCTPPVGVSRHGSMAPCGERVQSKRPVREVFDTVNAMLDLVRSTKKQQTRYYQLTSCLVEETCPIPELSIFYSYLQALLGKIFDPIAQSAEANAASPGQSPGGEDDECPILTMLTEQVVKDVIDAARGSLKAYHRYSRKRKGFGPSKLLGKSLTGLPGLQQRNGSVADANASLSHTLSCRSMPRTGAKADKHQLGAAFSGACSSPNSPATSSTKRRSEARIDRKGTVQGTKLPDYDAASKQAKQGEPIDVARGASGDSMQQSVSHASNLKRMQSLTHSTHTSMRNMGRYLSMASGTHVMTRTRSEATAGGDLSSKRLGSGLSQTHIIPSHITTAQYFDIIIETICVVLCVKYEHQLMELTTEGESSGIRRAAEWVAARILDELYNDGIDPDQPLCAQLILCSEGLALEDGQYVWRHCSSVEIDVMYVVWGEPPPDVLSGKLEAKDPSETWFEWGVFAQPGIRTPDGKLFTCPRLNPLQYRYRLAPAMVASSLGLANANENPAVLRAPSFLHARPGQRVMCEMTGEHFEGITVSAPPEGSEHKGGTVPRPHIRPKNMSARNALEEKYRQKYGVTDEEYTDADVYEWGFEEAMREQQRQQHGGASSANYQHMQGERTPCCPKCVIS